MEDIVLTWIIPVVSFLIALAGLGFGFYQHYLKVKLEKQVKIESKIQAIIRDFDALSVELKTGNGLINPTGSDAFTWVIKHGIPHGDIFDMKTNEKVFSILHQIDLVFDEISKANTSYNPAKPPPFFLHLEINKLFKEVINPMNEIFVMVLTENKLPFTSTGELFVKKFHKNGTSIFEYWERIYMDLYNPQKAG